MSAHTQLVFCVWFTGLAVAAALGFVGWLAVALARDLLRSARRSSWRIEKAPHPHTERTCYRENQS